MISMGDVLWVISKGDGYGIWACGLGMAGGYL